MISFSRKFQKLPNSMYVGEFVAYKFANMISVTNYFSLSLVIYWYDSVISITGRFS
jgi:hypothetical protein